MLSILNEENSVEIRYILSYSSSTSIMISATRHINILLSCDLTRFYHVTIEDELQDWESALSLNSLRTLTWQILQECGVGVEEDEVESDGSARSASGVCLPVFQV